MDENKELENEINGLTVRPDYASEIVGIIRSNLTPKILRDRVADYHENDIAEAIDELDGDERKKFFSVLDAETLANVLEYSENRASYLDELQIRRKIAVLSSFDPAVAAEYLDELEEEEQEKILGLMDGEAKSEVDLILSFDDDEIGSRMTTNYISVSDGLGVKEAMKALVEQAAENDNVSTLYVAAHDGMFIGAIDLKDLIVARKQTSLEDITMTTYPYVYANEKIDECIERIKDYSEDSIPVLDSENRLIGVLISQEIIQLVDDEMSEDYAKLAGLSSEEDLNEPLVKSIGKRLPWLIVLLGLGLLVSSVVGVFEHVVAHLTLIACFQSLILGMAGNVGTQSLAVTIRVLMDENLSTKQKLFLIVKEARIGLINGLILGTLSFVIIGFYIALFNNYPFSYAFSVSFCTGAALALAILISSIVGTATPIIFKKLKIDPAVASGPLITTINDLVAVVSYYGLAWVLLINVLGL